MQLLIPEQKIGIEEKRSSKRILFPFPVKVSGGLMGTTVNLNDTGVCLILEKPLLSSQIVSTKIDLSFSSFESHAKIIWSRLIKHNRFICGLRFLRLGRGELYILQEGLSACKALNPEFVNITNNMRHLLIGLKNKCDQYDIINKNEFKRTKFIEKIKSKVCAELNRHFEGIWKIVKNFTTEKYKLHKEYYQTMLGFLMLDIIEINRFVNKKPLGYSGDFIVLNYLYDFHEQYLGGSSYEKIINFYTCNILISRSVIKRKNILKQKILEILGSNSTNHCRILSIGSGPARELIELIHEGKITKPLYFDCLDFESQALDFVKNEIEKIDSSKKNNLHLKLIHNNFLDLVKDKDFNKNFGKYDLIYSSGLFDYLKEKIASRITEKLFKSLKTASILMLTNADKKCMNHRVYYEMLGEWGLIYRTEEEMLRWTKDITDAQEIRFEDLGEENSFLVLSLKKS